MAYSNEFVTGLEWLWGKGFLSPGGPSEVALILEHTTLNGKRVLDIGCGIGGIDRLLVQKHGAAHVTGIDVEPHLLERARADAEVEDLGECIDYQLADNDILEFDDQSFDIVFSKDSIIHIEDKQFMFNEIWRVLKSGGAVAGSDWLGAEGNRKSQRMEHWLAISDLNFTFISASELRQMLENAGFTSVSTRDRNKWYQQAVRDEIDKVTGKNRDAFVEIVGEERARQRFESSSAKLRVVDAGELRPTHFFGVKP